MNAPRPDWYTVDAYQTASAKTPSRHITKARTLKAMVPGLKVSELYHACTVIRIPALYGPDVTEYRHELQISPAVHAYLQRASRTSRFRRGVSFM